MEHETTTAEFKVDKTTWGPGEWQDEPDRVDFVHAGLACLALRHPDHGHWCGYVGVPPEHPFHGKAHAGVDGELSVHGGINYSARCSGFICHVPQAGMPDDVWWLGFDCAHVFDKSPGIEARWNAIKARGVPELAELASRPTRIDLMEVYRPLPYVRGEIESLAEQLAGVPMLR